MEYKTLLERLCSHSGGSLAMHMPGHKRNISLDGGEYLEKLAADIDITEIDGFDDLYHAEGVLKESMERASLLFGTRRSFYLVNGSTQGILSAICSQIKRNDKVICARNCHKSVYNALRLSGADAFYIMPKTCPLTGAMGRISPSEVQKAFDEHPDAKMLIMTSPTYEGLISDTKEISEICHKRGALLFVDAAHGAHLDLFSVFGGSARRYADITVESLHKTLFCLTQTAIIHLGDSLSHEREEKLMNSLAVFGTSSPSYLLMASIDSAVDHLIKDGERILGSLAAALSEFYKKTELLEKLSVIRGGCERDPLKIVITADKIKGKSEELVRLLRERRIEPEMVAPTYVLCMAGLGDTRESLEKLSAALLEIDKMLSLSEDNCPQIVHTHLPMRSGMKDPFDRNYREASLEKANGMISAEYLWAYPPGIPIITPGEIFDGEIIGVVKSYYESGLSLYSDKRGRIYCSDTLCVISD